MTPNEIEKLAGHRTVSPWVMKLVLEAVELEREACAKVCEDDMGWLDNGGGELCAKAIRVRGEK